MRNVKKHTILIIATFILIAFAIETEKKRGVTSSNDPLANGVLKLQVRNDSLKYICHEIKVKNGVFNSCDNNQLIQYEFFIKREEIDSNWLLDPIRIYNYFPNVGGTKSTIKWFAFEDRSSHNYKEDFTSNTQISGITYRHHESKKNIVSYTIANPTEKIFNDTSKFQFKYDWLENIKGRYESFFEDGSKRFRHKYVLNRFIVLNTKINSPERQSNCDITLNGVIESYHKTGKKKEVVIYNDIYITEQKANEKRIIVKSKRSGERKVYYDSGRLLCSGSIDIKGFKGEVTYYAQKKEIIKTSNFKDGILDGKTREFYIDGVVKMKGEYTSGLKSGKWEYFDSLGKKTGVTRY